eukprot:gnl/MRDRNA2_/MRDRNA2_150014_c0_seq1.p1 gnl/MRDRNA2_/MRDRNA2_150014_c0~~gnl/MRDRNA2_/MRDRNA2_150014_c0_seq1.p1  ORF type:complete len:144 (-),score=24.16 gnl/MRDRNA2_/MRDRNA2_150014_c0_seq1:97-528(-)
MGQGRSAPREYDAKASEQLLEGVRRCDPRRISEALSTGADPDSKGKTSGRPAVCSAIKCDTAPEVIELLIQAKADLTASDSDGWTALHTCAAWNNDTAIRRIMAAGGRKINVNAKDNLGRTPLTIAERRNSGIAALLRRHKAT